MIFRQPARLGATQPGRVYSASSGILRIETPEHCLVNGSFQLHFDGKSHVSNGCKMYLLRSPVHIACVGNPLFTGNVGSNDTNKAFPTCEQPNGIWLSFPIFRPARVFGPTSEPPQTTVMQKLAMYLHSAHPLSRQRPLMSASLFNAPRVFPKTDGPSFPVGFPVRPCSDSSVGSPQRWAFVCHFEHGEGDMAELSIAMRTSGNSRSY